MDWRAAILFTLILIVPFISADGCDTSEVFKGMDIIKKFVQEWKSSKNPTFHKLLKITDRFESMLKGSENFNAEECNAEQREQLLHMITFPVTLLADEYEAAEGALSLIKNEKAVEHITSLICSFDCNALLDFAQNAKNVDTKTNTFNTLRNLLKYTDLSNTVIDVSVPFIENLHKHIGEGTDENVLPVMKTLLHQAIKTDLILEHHNSEALYAIDKELTAEIIQELINEKLNTPLKNNDAVENFPLFEILKCPDQLALWIEHLQLVFNKLKENNKLKSAYSLILLKNIHFLKEKVHEEGKQKLANIEKELPAVLHKILYGEACVQYNDDNKTKFFLSNTYEEDPNQSLTMKKFVAKADGSVTLVNTRTAGEHRIFLLEKTDDLDGVFDFPIEVQHGEMELVFSFENRCKAVSNACIPYMHILPQINMTTNDFDIFKKFAHYYINQSGCDFVLPWYRMG